MLQPYTAPQPAFYEDRDQALDPARFIEIFKRRIFYFAIPFVALLIIGFLIVAIQRPIYRAQGTILVELAQIPTDLVEPTVTAAATERIQVIQQRLMARDSLLPIVNKFNLFPSERGWMSGTELLDLMRDRSQIALVDLDELIAAKDTKDGKPAPAALQLNRQNKNPAVAFTVTFDYENPDLAARVANELLTAILNQDVQARTNRATETTRIPWSGGQATAVRLDTVEGQILQTAADRQKTLAADAKKDDEKAQSSLSCSSENSLK